MLKLMGWKGVHALNIFIILFFLINGTGFGLVRPETVRTSQAASGGSSGLRVSGPARQLQDIYTQHTDVGTYRTQTDTHHHRHIRRHTKRGLTCCCSMQLKLHVMSQDVTSFSVAAVDPFLDLCAGTGANSATTCE